MRLLIILTLLLTTQAFARGGGQGKFNLGKRIFQDMNLNEQQEKDLITLKQSNRAKMQTHKQTTRGLRDQLKALMMADNVDNAKIKALIEKIGNESKVGVQLKVDEIKALKKILSKDQLRKLNLDMLWSPRKGGRGMNDQKRQGRRGMGMGQGRGQHNGDCPYGNDCKRNNNK